MIFTNINIISILIVSIFFIIGGYFIIESLRNKKSKLSLLLLSIVLICLSVSILGPKGDFGNQSSTVSGGNIAFLIDVSKSMNALDFDQERASRLDISKYLIAEFVKQYKNNAYSLDVFSGEAIKLLPFTTDTSIYQTVLSGVDESSVGKSGTDILGAIYASISHFDDESSGLIVMFTDGGEDAIDDLGDIEKTLKQKDINLLIVGVGNQSGSYIPTGTDFFGRTIYKTYEGKKVLTQLNASELKAIAKSLGEYIQLDSISDIDRVSDTIDSLSEDIDISIQSSQRNSLVYIYVLIGFLSWLLFLVNMILSKYKKK